MANNFNIPVFVGIILTVGVILILYYISFTSTHFPSLPYLRRYQRFRNGGGKQNATGLVCDGTNKLMCQLLTRQYEAIILQNKGFDRGLFFQGIANEFFKRQSVSLLEINGTEQNNWNQLSIVEHIRVDSLARYWRKFDIVIDHIKCCHQPNRNDLLKIIQAVSANGILILLPQTVDHWQWYLRLFQIHDLDAILFQNNNFNFVLAKISGKETTGFIPDLLDNGMDWNTCEDKEGFSYFCIGNDLEFCLQMNKFYLGNAEAPQKFGKLCQIMDSFKSDKCQRHNYTKFYEFMFAKYRDKPADILEIGLGTNNVEIASNMGSDGKPGASLRGWKSYFPKAEIFGADIDREILFQEDRIKTFHVDVTKNDSIDQMFNQMKVPSFDVIIEDSLHEIDAQLNFYSKAIPHLKPDGIYITEDVGEDTCLKMFKFFQNDVRNQPFFNFIRTKGPDYDSLIAVIRKHK